MPRSDWMVELWQGDNGRWRWALYHNGENVRTSTKSTKTRDEALGAARDHRRTLEGKKRERISLDDE